MSEERHLAGIEERLHAEAGRLLAQGQGLSASRLAEMHRGRQRRRRAAQAAAAFVLAALAVRFGGRRAELANAPAAPPRATVATLERGTTARGQNRSQGSPVPQTFRAAEQPDQAVLGIPFVISDPAGAEEPITGIYVPEQVEPIDLGKLSPAEQDAVRAVFGIEGEDTDVIHPI